MPTISGLASPSDHGRLAGCCPMQWKLAVAAADTYDGWHANSCTARTPVSTPPCRLNPAVPPQSV